MTYVPNLTMTTLAMTKLMTTRRRVDDGGTDSSIVDGNDYVHLAIIADLPATGGLQLSSLDHDDVDTANGKLSRI